MAATQLTITCSSCGAETRADLPHRDLESGAEDSTRLLGTAVTCEQCGSEFDCYYY